MHLPVFQHVDQAVLMRLVERYAVVKAKVMQHAGGLIDQSQRLRPARLVGGGEKPKQKGVVARFDADDVMRIGLAQVVEMRCVGTQRVLEDDDRQVRMVPAKRLEPATCGVAFAVVFGVTILVNNRLRGQRDYFFEVGMDQRGTQQLVVVGHAAAAMVLLQTRSTVNLGGGKIARPVQRQQVMAVEIDEPFQRLAALQAAKDITEQRPQVVGIDRIEEGPHLGVAGNVVDGVDGRLLKIWH